MATALPDLIAEEHLNFIANFKDRETFLGKWENRFDATRTKCFEVQFGIQGRDGNLYPFSMSLFYLEALWNGGDQIRQRYFLTLWPTENFSAVLVDEEIALNDQKFTYKGPLIKKGPNGQRGLEFTQWEVSEEDQDLIQNKNCRVRIDIKIYGVIGCEISFNTAYLEGKDKNGSKEPKLKFLERTFGNFKIVGQDKMIGTTNMKKFFKLFNGKEGRKEYYVDKSQVIKESDILRSMISANAKASRKIVLYDTNSQTLEAFLIFCYTGYLPMSAINQNLAKFIFKYKLENLTSLLDKFVSMSLTARDAENWTKWAPKLNLKNTALRIWLLKRGAKEIWTKICQEDKEFAAYIGLIVGTASEHDLFPDYGKFGDLDFSENLLIN